MLSGSGVGQSDSLLVPLNPEELFSHSVTWFGFIAHGFTVPFCLISPLS